jgi:alpha-soluble NSF attachment protein
MVDNREKEAYKLIETANKKIKGSFFSNIFSSQNSRFEDGLDLFVKAANMLKLAKNWEKAGEAFEKCGEIEEKLEADPASHFLEASHCYSFTNETSIYKTNNRVH